LTSIHRVLVVEDHEPFRQVVRGLLDHRPDVQIVGEAADGMDALRQAEAHRPDVVLLDIGLPMLSGMEVADRLRETVPDARVMFVTNESSVEVMESAFRRGARGYVYKPRALRDVVPVFDAIVRGGRFISGGLERIARGDSLAVHAHQLLFWSSDSVLVESFTRFVTGALGDGNAVIVTVTETHRQYLEGSLIAAGVDLAGAIRQGLIVSLSISDVCASVMVEGRPDPARLRSASEALVVSARERIASPSGRVAWAGESSAAFWAMGHVDAAMQMEALGDELAQRHQMDVLCAFPLTTRDESQRAVHSLCAEHTSVEIS
jgi:DNA-binding NarL/FixJ family response regulator